eukprot:2491462-Pleurochrysis_carterae.AAC.4
MAVDMLDMSTLFRSVIPVAMRFAIENVPARFRARLSGCVSVRQFSATQGRCPDGLAVDTRRAQHMQAKESSSAYWTSLISHGSRKQHLSLHLRQIIRFGEQPSALGVTFECDCRLSHLENRSQFEAVAALISDSCIALGPQGSSARSRLRIRVCRRAARGGHESANTRRARVRKHAVGTSPQTRGRSSTSELHARRTEEWEYARARRRSCTRTDARTHAHACTYTLDAPAHRRRRTRTHALALSTRTCTCAHTQ